MTFSVRAQFDLTDRVAVVTGAAHILGPQFASALLECGAHVVLVDIDQERCRETARQLSAEFGGRSTALVCDVSNEAAVARMRATVIGAHGKIDILINGAATKTPGFYDSVAEYSLEDWNRVVAVNLTGTFLCTKHFLPDFIARGGGTIINIGSIYGTMGADRRIYQTDDPHAERINTPAVYGASKGGIVNLTRHLATDLAPHHIRVNCLNPGGVFDGHHEDFVSRYSARVPMARMAEREELRAPLLFLASDASSYVTGQILQVDGGLSAW